jgi:hypothetical protein
MGVMVKYAAVAFGCLLISGCASSKPSKGAPFLLVAGKRIGRLELVVDKESGFTKKTRDSVKFDNQYLNTKPRIGFAYPGETVTMMKIFDGEKLLKSCDEGSYAHVTGSHYAGGTPGTMSFKAGGGASFTPGSFGGAQKTDEYVQKYNLECEVAEVKDGMTVELYDPDGMVSKYKVAYPVE